MDFLLSALFLVDGGVWLWVMGDGMRKRVHDHRADYTMTDEREF